MGHNSMRCLDDHHGASYCWDGVLLGVGKFFLWAEFRGYACDL